MQKLASAPEYEKRERRTAGKQLFDPKTGKMVDASSLKKALQKNPTDDAKKVKGKGKSNNNKGSKGNKVGRGKEGASSAPSDKESGRNSNSGSSENGAAKRRKDRGAVSPSSGARADVTKSLAAREMERMNKQSATSESTVEETGMSLIDNSGATDPDSPPEKQVSKLMEKLLAMRKGKSEDPKQTKNQKHVNHKKRKEQRRKMGPRTYGTLYKKLASGKVAVADNAKIKAAVARYVRKYSAENVVVSGRRGNGNCGNVDAKQLFEGRISNASSAPGSPSLAAAAAAERSALHVLNFDDALSIPESRQPNSTSPQVVSPRWDTNTISDGEVGATSWDHEDSGFSSTATPFHMPADATWSEGTRWSESRAHEQHEMLARAFGGQALGGKLSLTSFDGTAWASSQVLADAGMSPQFSAMKPAGNDEFNADISLPTPILGGESASMDHPAKGSLLDSEFNRDMVMGALMTRTGAADNDGSKPSSPTTSGRDPAKEDPEKS